MALTLVIDTSLNACTAALFDGGAVLAQASEPMVRGHQERLAVMVADLFQAAVVRPSDLGHIGVTLGPGSFTGMRVGLAFAKGLAAGTGLKLKGFGTLEALGYHPDLLQARRLSVIDGGRGRLYLQVFTPQGRGEPEIWTAGSDNTPYADIDVLTGPAAMQFSAVMPAARILTQDYPAIDALHALTLEAGHDDLTPLYMRDADAIASTRGIISLGTA